MELIADSQKVQSTKTYFYFQQAGPDGKMTNIVWILQRYEVHADERRLIKRRRLTQMIRGG